MNKLSLTLILIFLTTLLSQIIIRAGEEPVINAQAGIVIDAQTGQVLYQKNPHLKLNPASITKLLTALVALDTLNPQDTITFSKEAIDSLDYGSSRIGIKEGETISVEDAFHGLLLMSANEVANAIAETSSGSISNFVSDMNLKAKELGALDSNFENPHGLTQANHLTTVYDMALITQEIIKNDYFLEIMQHTMYQIPATNKEDEIRYLSQQHKMLNNKNDMRIYREDVIAGKVGYTKESGHTLVTAASQEDRTLIVVIMNTDYLNLYTDTEKLLDYGFDQFTSVTLDSTDLQTSLDINKDDEYTSHLLLSNVATNILLPDGYSKDLLTYDYHIKDNIDPTSSVVNDLAGTCDILLEGNIILNIPLLVEAVELNIIEVEAELINDTIIEEVVEDIVIKDEKKSLLPIMLILVGFPSITLLCLPKKKLTA